MSIATTGLPSSIVDLIQQQALERVFHENLFPRLLYRSEAMAERWDAHIGEVKVFTRPGLLARVLDPLTPGTDPTPQSFNFEQWIAEARQFGSSIDTHMPSSYVALAPLFLRNIAELGKQAGLSLNTLARNALFRAYLGGDTVSTVGALAGATQLRVASLNGFLDTIPASSARPTPVSSLNPLAISIGVVGEPANAVVGVSPDDPNAPTGPGTISLQSPTTNPIPARSAVKAANRSVITRVGGAATVDGITGLNLLTMQDIINTIAVMQANNVGPQPDGYYHVHLSPEGVAQIFADPVFQRLHQSLPESAAYREFGIGQLLGCRFYRNVENPNLNNTGPLVSTGTKAYESPSLGAEVVNNNGVQIRRTIIVGGGALYEQYLDENAFLTEAGVTGKIGEFSVINGGVQVMTDRIRMILRAPLDRLQQIVSSSWSWSGDFVAPSDALTGSPARYKRAAVIEHS